MDYSLFDIRSYREEKGIEYHTSGKNVTTGWIELNCPFCSDPSYHLGISELGLFNCWRCGAKGTIIKLIMEYESITYSKAIKELSKYYLSDLKELKQDIQKRYDHNILPKEATKDFPSLHLDYLVRERKFPTSVIQEYDLYACYMIGEYKYRIICPVIEDGKIVNFTAMAVSGQNPKYKHCPNHQAIIPMKECLYNIDTVDKTAVIMEGVTDVWRFGIYGVAVMGIEFSQEQINLLVKRKIQNAFIIFDAEELAQRKAEKMANQLSSFIDHVEVINIGVGDPGMLSFDEISHLRRDLKL